MRQDRLLRVALVGIVLGLLLTVLAVTDCAAQDKPLTGLRIGLVSLQAGDYTLTQIALHRDGFREANPIMPTGPVKMAIVKAATAGVSWWAIGKLAKRNKRVAYIVTGALVGLNAVVVVHNVRVMR